MSKTTKAVFTVCLMTAFIIAFMVAADLVILFEDGSIQLLNNPNLGYCIFPSWGCSW